MKTPQEYADELINVYSAIGLQQRDEAFQCAIIDFKNTIEALRCINEQIHINNYDYYKEVLTILESKL